MKVKCLIVDDEPIAINALEELLKKFDNIEIVQKCSDAVHAFEEVRKNHIDLIFLDIEMPEVSGINFLKTLKNPPQVIFTTAYRNYAIEAFDLNVVDYLLKPISFERLLKAIDKFYLTLKNDLFVINSPVSNTDEKAFLYIKADKKIHKIYLDDILYIESLKDYVYVITNKKKVITKQQMYQFEQHLPENKFIRIHRSYLVSIPKIETFTTSTIEIADRELPVSRNYKNNVVKALNISQDII